MTTTEEAKERIWKMTMGLLETLEGANSAEAMSALSFAMVMLGQDLGYSTAELQEALSLTSEQMAKSGQGETWA